MEYFEVLSNAVYDAIEDGEVAIKVSCETMHKLIEMNKELLAALEHLHHNARASGAEMGLALDVAVSAIAKAKATS